MFNDPDHTLQTEQTEMNIVLGHNLDVDKITEENNDYEVEDNSFLLNTMKR